MTAKIISFINSKGGQCKTSCCRNIAGILAKDFEKKILLIDTDLSGDLTHGFPIDSNPSKSFYLALHGYILTDNFSEDINDCITHTEYPNIDILPSEEKVVMAIENSLRQNEDCYKAFSDIIEDYLRDKYDYIIFDIGAGKSARNIITRAALIASDYALSPYSPTEDGANGVLDAMSEVKWAQKRKSQLFIGDIKFLGAFIADFDARTKLANDTLINANEYFPGNSLNIKIRHAQDVSNSRSEAKPLCYYAPNSKANQDYKELAEFIIKITEE